MWSQGDILNVVQQRFQHLRTLEADVHFTEITSWRQTVNMRPRKFNSAAELSCSVSHPLWGPIRAILPGTIRAAERNQEVGPSRS